MTALESIECQRLEAQGSLDAAKSHVERNRLGQFATPPALAIDILAFANSLLPKNARVRFLDPAFGTGSFYSALLRVFSASRIESATGYEIDLHYGRKAQELWMGTKLRLKLSDFTRSTPPSSDLAKSNLLICNPPYVRHHHLKTEEKLRLQGEGIKSAGVQLSGLAGLYCHFICVSHRWMARDGIAGWLVPSEFMGVNYGEQLKRYLLDRVTLLRIHRFDPNDVQFGDALVSSAVVWFKNSPPPQNHRVEFSFGGSLSRPLHLRRISVDALRQTPKWTRFPLMAEDSPVETEHPRISDLFVVKRGIATGANDFFILGEKEAAEHHLPRRFLQPILPSPRYLHTDEVRADANGLPLLEKRSFLVSCELSEHEVKDGFPALWNYFQEGVKAKISRNYLCTHRSPWYSQEMRSPTPFLCTYMGRSDSVNGRPFRFILNHSKAIAANVYLMLYPKPALAVALQNKPGLDRKLWQALNRIPSEALIGEGRVYGGGLYKMEPKELANAVLPNLSRASIGIETQAELFRLRTIAPH